jgi:hypothetical protein
VFNVISRPSAQSQSKEPSNLDIGSDRKTVKSKDERISQAPSSNVKRTPMKKGESYEEEVKESPFKPTPSKPQKQGKIITVNRV